jgi:hypothetical protein
MISSKGVAARHVAMRRTATEWIRRATSGKGNDPKRCKTKTQNYQ